MSDSSALPFMGTLSLAVTVTIVMQSVTIWRFSLGAFCRKQSFSLGFLSTYYSSSYSSRKTLETASATSLAVNMYVQVLAQSRMANCRGLVCTNKPDKQKGRHIT